ncbi:hypothetical protein R3W88_011586 [Solanum pinnatisectum]|uniref:endo-polygalacturonase n=1 Tax=Solanum pinnatisectum TaxID=50273 RepID=A0AAV9L755_9SOLN|nr:hypothetical protein R3W88_011586 [Solanum pinnatisectum]
MAKILFFLFLVWLMGALGAAKTNFLDDVILSELDDLDVEDGDEAEFGNKILVNIDSFGAVGDGASDDTKAFVDAWKQTCSTPKSVFFVPAGRSYLVNATRFRGPCVGILRVQIEGTIVAPDDPKNWNFAKNGRIWLGFFNLTGLCSKWWAASCKKNKTNPCVAAPTLRYKGEGPNNPKWPTDEFSYFSIRLYRITGVTVSAPEDSPNTDGIHITESTNVVLQNSKIGTGDDCVSIVNASSSIKMKRIYCGPGHGISIGSLGKDNSVGIVTGVVLDNAFLRGTTNGLRIKTWQGGSGYVRAVRFQNVRMQNVSNPIIIDQFYCDSPKSCQNQTSAVEISEIVYRNVSGTSKSQKAIKFACSDNVPCSHIVLNNINLETRDGTAEVYCNSIQGLCLNSSDKKIKQKMDAGLDEPREEYIIHTEL